METRTLTLDDRTKEILEKARIALENSDKVELELTKEVKQRAEELIKRLLERSSKGWMLRP